MLLDPFEKQFDLPAQAVELRDAERGQREECGQVANMDRRLGLRARGHRQEAAQPLGESVRNPTDPELDHVRTNFVGSTACSIGATAAHCLHHPRLNFA